jgi:hypothetical protein
MNPRPPRKPIINEYGYGEAATGLLPEELRGPIPLRLGVLPRGAVDSNPANAPTTGHFPILDPNRVVCYRLSVTAEELGISGGALAEIVGKTRLPKGVETSPTDNELLHIFVSVPLKTARGRTKWYVPAHTVFNDVVKNAAKRLHQEKRGRTRWYTPAHIAVSYVVNAVKRWFR